MNFNEDKVRTIKAKKGEQSGFCHMQTMRESVVNFRLLMCKK